MIHPVILAGGAGTCRWPVSHQPYPRPFATPVPGCSAFQRVLDRVCGSSFAAPMVITTARSCRIVRRQLAEMGVTPTELVIAPEGETAAAAILTAALVRRETPEAVLAVLPGDHVTDRARGFCLTVERAARSAREGAIAAIVNPSDPAGPGRADLRVVHRPPEALTRADDGWLSHGAMYLFRVDTALAAFAAEALDLLTPGMSGRAPCAAIPVALRPPVKGRAMGMAPVGRADPHDRVAVA